MYVRRSFWLVLVPLPVLVLMLVLREQTIQGSLCVRGVVSGGNRWQIKHCH